MISRIQMNRVGKHGFIGYKTSPVIDIKVGARLRKKLGDPSTLCVILCQMGV